MSLQTKSDKSLSRASRAFSLLREGSEPDPRFTLANERTFLAWIRTALALLAGGVAVDALAPELLGHDLQEPLSAFLLIMAMLISASATLRWIRVERALRLKEPLPLPMMVPLLALVGLLSSVAVFVYG